MAGQGQIREKPARSRTASIFFAYVKGPDFRKDPGFFDFL
jgi:hypothetical protein